MKIVFQLAKFILWYIRRFDQPGKTEDQVARKGKVTALYIQDERILRLEVC